MKHKTGTIATLVSTNKGRIKAAIIVYGIEFLLIFATLFMLYAVIFEEDKADKISECLKYHDLDYCNRNVD